MLSSVLAEFSASGFGSVSATSNHEVVAEVELNNFSQTCLRVLRWMQAAVPYSGSHDSVIPMVCSIQGHKVLQGSCSHREHLRVRLSSTKYNPPPPTL